MSFPLLTHANKSRIEIAKKNFLEIIQTALKLQEGFSLIFPILPCQRHRIKMTFYIFMNIITIDLLIWLTILRQIMIQQVRNSVLYNLRIRAIYTTYSKTIRN